MSYVPDVYTDVLGNRVMLVNLDGPPHSAWVPPLDVSDELGIVPKDDVILPV